MFSAAGGVPPSSTSKPVVISADLIAIGDHDGYFCLNSAARPATCGLDIEVPLYRSNRRPLFPGGATPARMSWPGAIRSGFSRLPPPASSGPREEKLAVNGAGALYTIVAALIVAVAPDVAAYALSAARSENWTWTVGTKWKSAFSELVGLLTSTAPTPPASATARLLLTRAKTPRSHSTILPATLAGSRTGSPPVSAVEAQRRTKFGSAPGRPAVSESMKGAGPTAVATDAP